MKKILSALLFSLTVAASALAQGTVAFSNLGFNNAYKISTNDVTGGHPGYMSGTNAYRIGLYAGALGSPAGSLTLVGLATNAAPAPVAGQFNGGNPFTINGLGSAGTQISFQLRGWSFAGGLTYEEALVAALNDPLRNIAIGYSQVGTTTLGGGTIPPGSLWSNTNPNGITGFQIAPPSPEPSSIALGLLGLSVFALFPGRK